MILKMIALIIAVLTALIYLFCAAFVSRSQNDWRFDLTPFGLDRAIGLIKRLF
jgi:hypothetical protein